MNYKDNIEYRNSIEEKAYNREKITESEKWWLRSNPVFNPRFDFGCYQRDIIKFKENRDITVTITSLNCKDKTKIFRPAIGVVGKGSIKVNSQLLDIDGKAVDCKETRILIPLFNETRNSTTVRVSSKAGLISVWYQCEYYDESVKAYTIEMSDGANLSYGMKKQLISDNEFLYHCKSPTDSTDNFDVYAFSVKIEESDI